MATATKTRKTTEVAQNAILNNVLPYEEKVRLMTLSVLREECGQELNRSARYNGNEFDWIKFKENFQHHYGELSTKELLALLKEYYGLQTIEQIRDRRAVHQERITKRMNQ